MKELKVKAVAGTIEDDIVKVIGSGKAKIKVAEKEIKIAKEEVKIPSKQNKSIDEIGEESII